MLVLSRRQGQRILFPELDISVQVLPSKGGTVRLGIAAPVNVSVLREEIGGTQPAKPSAHEAERQARHDLLGQVNTLAMALHVIEKQLQAGLTADAARTLGQAREVLERIPATVGHSAAPADSPIEALLVEDDVNEEALLSGYLRMNGFRVQTAHDGYEALEILASHERPDFILMDMRLARFDGPSTVSAIRQIPAYRGMKIFAVTGSSPAEFNLSTGEAGVNAWFQKPLNPKSLVDAMSAAVSNN